MPDLEAKYSPSYVQEKIYVGGSVLSVVSGIQGWGRVLEHIPTGLGGDYGTV